MSRSQHRAALEPTADLRGDLGLREALLEDHDRLARTLDSTEVDVMLEDVCVTTRRESARRARTRDERCNPSGGSGGRHCDPRAIHQQAVGEFEPSGHASAKGRACSARSTERTPFISGNVARMSDETCSMTPEPHSRRRSLRSWAELLHVETVEDELSMWRVSLHRLDARDVTPQPRGDGRRAKQTARTWSTRRRSRHQARQRVAVG